MVQPQSLSERKAVLRRAALAAREVLTAEHRRAAAQLVAARPFPGAIAAGDVVSGFMPMAGEFDPLPLMRALAGRGAALALPVVAGRGKPLVMRAYAFGDALASGPWGIRQPEAQAREVFPDVVLVPFAAFDRRGHRIGYGAAYYDMTLTRLRGIKRALAVGIGFAAQEIAEVPAEPHDARLDLVLTEREIIDCRGG